MSRNLILPFYRAISKRYIAGETIDSVIKQQINLLSGYSNPKKIGMIIDYVDEGRNPDNYFKQCLIASKTEYILPSMIAIKCSGLGLGVNKSYQSIPINEIRNKIECIASVAFENGNHIIIDAEQVEINDEINFITDEVVSVFNNNFILPKVYRTFQMYRKDSFQDLQKYISTYPNGGVKLVRGAYLEEDKHTGKLYTSKEETDDNYNKAIRYLANFTDNNNILIASHNSNSCEIASNFNLEENKFQFAQLLGMSDYLTYQLNEKHMTYKYIPYGPLDEAVPYLTRRLQENAHMIKHMLK